jgi:uncharacterized repeat protein (TIGR03803 family)
MILAGRSWLLITVCVAMLAFPRVVSAQVSYGVVADLGTIGGTAPLGGVIRGADAALYGTTSEGGTANCGIVYRLDAAGALSRIHTFNTPDGCHPVGELTLAPDGSLYGVTHKGAHADPQRDGGTIYKIAADGTFTVVYRFVLPVEEPPEPWLIPFGPFSALTLGPDGQFYGTTLSSDVYRISLDGVFALVHQFSAEFEPQEMSAALIVGPDGLLYGTSPTTLALITSAGAIYRVSPAGDAEVLHRFPAFRPPPGFPSAPEGRYPVGELAAGPGGEFYAANSEGGPSVTDAGTIVRLEADGRLTVLHAFLEGSDGSYPDGANPRGGLILAADGQVYGTTSAGGANGNGTIFRIDPDGVLTTLWSFAQNGFAPTKGRLLELTPGVFIGTAPSTTGGVVYQLRTEDAGGEPPVAHDTTLSTNENTSATAALSATDPDSTDLMFEIVAGPTKGTVQLVDASTGRFTYAPNDRATGEDSFTFRVSDGTSVSNVATVRISIAPARPRVLILFPLAIAPMTIGTTQPIVWLHDLDPGSLVRVDLSRDDGATWETIVPSVRNATRHLGFVPWQVTGPPTTSARIRVMSLSTGAFDVTNRPLTIAMRESSSRNR